MVANTNSATNDEVHLKDFLFFVVDYILVLLLRELSWSEAKGHIVEELAVLVLLWVEEESEVVEDVIEQVVDNDATLDRLWQHVDELVVLLHLTQSIVKPVVFKVLVNLLVQRVWQWLVVSESCQ